MIARYSNSAIRLVSCLRLRLAIVGAGLVLASSKVPISE
jgi:hypothetical protein